MRTSPSFPPQMSVQSSFCGTDLELKLNGFNKKAFWNVFNEFAWMNHFECTQKRNLIIELAIKGNVGGT